LELRPASFAPSEPRAPGGTPIKDTTMRWQVSAILVPFAMLVSPARAAPQTITPAQAACDEQAGDFHRENGVAY